MRINSKGQVVAGIGKISIDHVVIDNGYNPGWFNDTTVVYSKGQEESIISYDIVSKVPTVVYIPGGNVVKAGRDIWARWANGPKGLVVSTGYNNPSAGLLEVGIDGILYYTPIRSSDQGIRARYPGGNEVLISSGPTAISLRGVFDGAVWVTPNLKPQVWNLPQPVVALPCYNPRAAKIGNEWWLVYGDGTRILAQPFSKPEGYVVANFGNTFDLDCIDIGSKLRVAYATTAAEGPNQYQVLDLDLTLPRVPLVPETQMIIPAVTVDKWTLKSLKDGEEFIFHDRNNLDLGYKCRVYIQGGSIYAEMTNAKGTAKTGTNRPVEKCPIVTPPIPPIPPGPVTDATIELNGKFFKRSNGERMTVIESSDFSLFKRYLDNDQLTDKIITERRDLRFNMLRVWLLNTGVVQMRNGVPQDGINPSQYPNFYERLTQFVDHLADNKLLVELTVFAINIPTEMPNESDQQVHLNKTANAVRGRKNVILELVNENDQYQNHVSPNLTRPSGVIISHGSNGADHSGVKPYWDYSQYHSNGLSEFQRKVGHNAMEYADLGNVPYISNENTRYPDQDSNENHAFDAAAGGALLCAGSCFHSNAGKYSRPFDDTELRCAKQWIAGANSVPTEYQTGVYARHDELNGPNVIRAYTRTLSDGRRWLLKIRP